MKAQIKVILLLFLLMFVTGCQTQHKTTQASQSQQKDTSILPSTQDTFNIRLSFNNKEMIATLDDNPTSRSFIEALPMEVHFEDFANAEKIASITNDMKVQPSIEGYDPLLYDIAFYAPWNNLVLFYKDQPYASGLYPMGKITSNMDYITDIKANDIVIIEQYT